MNAAIGVVVLVIVVTALIRLSSSLSRRRQRPSESAGSPSARLPRPDEAGPAPAPPFFRVLALGAAGSGKTVFLSSMFHELDHRSQRRRYYLDTSAEQRILLSEIYSTVSDTSKPFPLATRKADMREFVYRYTRWHRRFANNLLKVWPALWTFTTIDRAASYYSFSRSVAGACAFGRRSWRASRARAGRAWVDDRARGGHGLLPVARWQHGRDPGAVDRFVGASHGRSVVWVARLAGCAAPACSAA